MSYYQSNLHTKIPKYNTFTNKSNKKDDYFIEQFSFRLAMTVYKNLKSNHNPPCSNNHFDNDSSTFIIQDNGDKRLTTD